MRSPVIQNVSLKMYIARVLESKMRACTTCNFTLKRRTNKRQQRDGKRERERKQRVAPRPTIQDACSAKTSNCSANKTTTTHNTPKPNHRPLRLVSVCRASVLSSRQLRAHSCASWSECTAYAPESRTRAWRPITLVQ